MKEYNNFKKLIYKYYLIVGALYFKLAIILVLLLLLGLKSSWWRESEGNQLRDIK